MSRTTLAFRTVLGTALASALLVAGLTVPAAAQTGSESVLDNNVLQGRIERVLDRLDAVFADDRNAAGGAPISEAKATALRREIQRLVLRARTAGLSFDAVVQAVQVAASDRFRGQIPGAFATATGDLDAHALIRGIIGSHRVAGVAKADTSYLSAVTVEGARIKIGERRPGVKEDAATPGAAAPDGPATDPLKSDPGSEAERRDPANRIATVAGRRFLIVQPGDTLSTIAREFYGDLLQYHRIYAANQDKLSNPNVVEPGTRLLIP